jgi:hypothetical protein
VEQAQGGENGHSSLKEEALSLGSQAWQLRKEGYSIWTIAKRLRVPGDLLVQILENFEGQLVLEARHAVDYYRALDLERLDELIAHYLALALSPIDSQKIDAAELDHSLKAAALIVRTIEAKARLLGLGELGREKSFAGRDVSDWMPSISKLLASARPGEQVEEK